MKKKLIAVFCLLSLFFSCSKQKKNIQSENLEKSNTDHLTIGFSIDTLAIERWRRDIDVFLASAKELGANVIVQNSGNTVDGQIRQIQYLIDKNVDAIVILAKKADSLSDVIKNAKAKNIPVISYDRLILNADIDLYLTIDSEQVGEKMAQEILRRVPSGSVYCLYGPTEDFNMTMAKRGVENVLNKSQLRINHVFYVDDWNYDLAYSHIHSLFSENKIPDAIICGNDAIANSVIQAIREVSPKSKICIAGQDADIANCQHIVNGRQDVTIYKPITELSKQAAFYAVQLGKGTKVKDLPLINATMNNGIADIPTLLLNPITVTKDNIDEVIIESGFHTREEVYRN